MSKKGSSWTEAEDEALTKVVRELQTASGKPTYEAHKVNWTTVASKIKGRTAGGCQARWNVSLDPTVDRSEWTAELDKRLLELFHDKGTNSWSKRAKALAIDKFTASGEPMRRSGADCCDRYFLLKKQGGAAVLPTTSTLKRSATSTKVDTGDSNTETAKEETEHMRKSRRK
jgi:hypothetical protein